MMRIKGFYFGFLFLLSVVNLCAEESEKSSTKEESNLLDIVLKTATHSVYFKESFYYNISVEEDLAGYRYLIFKPCRGAQSTINIADPEKVCSGFCKTAFLSFAALKNEPKTALFIGLGGGILPMHFQKLYPACDIDIIELDPVVNDIAEKFFNFKPNHQMHVIYMDGRIFVNMNKKKYDLIVLDAYGVDCPPFHLTTQEFFKKVSQSLSPNGILTVNLAHLNNLSFINSEIKTIRSVFPHCMVFTSPNQGNWVPIVSMAPIHENFAKNVKTIAQQMKNNFDLNLIFKNQLSDEQIQKMEDDGVLLTDNYAPVERLQK